MKWKNLLRETTTVLFILLWVYAAVSKLLDYETFRAKIGQSPLLTPIAGFVAWFVPFVEIGIALMLSFRRTQQIGILLSFGLINLFAFYIIAITHFTSSIPCSCGGILEHMTWNQHLLFNIGFSLLAFLSFIMSVNSGPS